MFAKRIESAKRRGIQLIDDLSGLSFHMQDGEEYDDMKKEPMDKTKYLKPGITQIVTHPFSLRKN